MFPDLGSLLGSEKKEQYKQTERGEFILVTDSDADGNFIIHHFLSSCVKDGKSVVFVTLAQSFGHYHAVAQKMGTNLNAAKESGQLIHIDGLQWSLELFQHLQAGNDDIMPVLSQCFRKKSLQPVYALIQEQIARISSNSSKPISIIIDDLSMLLNFGFQPIRIQEFIHYCWKSVRGSCGNQGHLITLLHQDEINGEVEDEDSHLLFTLLAHRADILLQVRGLKSGYSTSVHGELTITHRHMRDSKPMQPTKQTVHFKVLDKNVSFFAIGTSSAVL